MIIFDSLRFKIKCRKFVLLQEINSSSIRLHLMLKSMSGVCFYGQKGTTEILSTTRDLCRHVGNSLNCCCVANSVDKVPVDNSTGLPAGSVKKSEERHFREISKFVALLICVRGAIQALWRAKSLAAPLYFFRWQIPLYMKNIVCSWQDPRWPPWASRGG